MGAVTSLTDERDKRQKLSETEQLVTHACGHVEVTDFFGVLKPAKFLAKLRLQPCRACAAAAAQAASDAEGLPILVGTEGQIRWAEVIRRQMIDQLPDLIAEERRTDNGEQADALAKLLSEARKRKYAKWFIENRKAVK